MHDLRQRHCPISTPTHCKNGGYRVTHSSRCSGALLIGIAAIAHLFAYEII